MEVDKSQLSQNDSYIGQAWGVAKNYVRHSYHLSYLYGKVRGMAQPWISTSFNVHQIDDGVYIGDIASASNIKQLKLLGITHIITAVLGVSPQFPKDFTYLNIPVMDVETEDIKPYLRQTSFFIDNAIAQGGKVLVHCMCGVSRSATIVAAWIMSRRCNTAEEAIKFIREKRDCVNPNSAFFSQLVSLENASLYANILDGISPVEDNTKSQDESLSTPTISTQLADSKSSNLLE